MKISASRFGTIEIREEQIIHMPSGMIGFPDDRRFALLEHRKGSPFFWFQSVDHETLAFVLINPHLFVPDYEIEISPEDLEILKLTHTPNGIQIFVVVNILSGNPVEITANLLGPIVINVEKKIAKQIVLSQASYSHRHPIPLTER